MQRATRHLFYGQLALFVGLLICLLLVPHFLFEKNEGGISNYGTITETILPFSLGFGLCGLFTMAATAALPRTLAVYKQLHGALLVLGVCYFLVLFSTYPYKVNGFLDNLHVYAGVALVIWDMCFGGWLIFVLTRDRLDRALFAAQSIGFVLAALTYTGLLHTLFIAESLVSAAFGVLLVRSVRAYIDTPQSTPKVRE